MNQVHPIADCVAGNHPAKGVSVIFDPSPIFQSDEQGVFQSPRNSVDGFLFVTVSIPASAKEITPEWLREALGLLLPEATFDSLNNERIGEDFGFASRIYRFHWLDDGESKSVVIKLWEAASKVETKEIEFYQRLGNIDVRIPTCYYAGFDEQAGVAVLVLEDIKGATQGDVLQSVDIDQARGIATNLARMQAMRVDQLGLDRYEWLTDVSNWSPDSGWIVSRRTMFRDRFEGRLGRVASDLLDRMDSAPAVANFRLADAPKTLSHGDFHLDNIMFETPSQPVFLDWSRPTLGPPAINLADLLFGMIQLELFDPTIDTYLDSYNQIAMLPLDEKNLERQLGGAFLRRFAATTCGLARWHPVLPRVIKTIDRDLQRTSDSADFWIRRDPDLFSSIGITA